MRLQSGNPFAYVIRQFPFLLFCCFAPALLLSFADNSPDVVRFWADYIIGNVSVQSFPTGFVYSHAIVNTSVHWYSIVFLLLGLSVLAIGWSMIVYRTDRHMQLGIKLNTKLFAKAMAIVRRVGLFIVLFFVINEVLMFLLVGIIYLLQSFVAFDVLGIVIFSLLVMSKILSCSLFYMLMGALPIIVSENYSLNEALGYSARANVTRTKKGQGVLFVLVSMLMWVVILLVHMLGMPRVVGNILASLVIAIWIMVVPILSCTRYMSDIGAERKDIKNIYF